MVVEMGHDDLLQDLLEVLLACDVTSDGYQIQLAVMGDAPPDHHGTATMRNKWLYVPWRKCCVWMPPNPRLAISDMKQEPALVGPVNPPPSPQVPGSPLKTPVQTQSFMAVCQQGAFDGPPCPQSMGFQAVLHSFGGNVSVWQPVSF